ncbi:hypothetical protein ACFQS4_01120 [Saliphagus sp. GCM10025317]
MPGTVYIDPGPDDSLEVGEAYTPAGIGDTMGAAEAPIVTFSFSFETEDGKKGGAFVEFEEHREFTVIEAKQVNEDGDLVDTDSITFTDHTLQTETPTDYDEVHDRLDEYEEFQKELLERQYELVETMAEDDETDTNVSIGFPSFGLGGEGAGLLGIGIIGVVVLAVVGIVTDLIPGLGN